MRLTTRIRTLEKRARDVGSGRDCPMCRGGGWSAILFHNAPSEARPADWPIGCPECGRIAHETVVSIGPSPTLAEARTFMEAI